MLEKGQRCTFIHLQWNLLKSIWETASVKFHFARGCFILVIKACKWALKIKLCVLWASSITAFQGLTRIPLALPVRGVLCSARSTESKAPWPLCSPVRPSTAGTEEEEKENPEGSAGELAGSRGCGVVVVPREPWEQWLLMVCWRSREKKDILRYLVIKAIL